MMIVLSSKGPKLKFYVVSWSTDRSLTLFHLNSESCTDFWILWYFGKLDRNGLRNAFG